MRRSSPVRGVSRRLVKFGEIDRLGDKAKCTVGERTCASFPAFVVDGRPMISYSPVSSVRRSPTWSCIGRMRAVLEVGNGGCASPLPSRFFSGRLAIGAMRGRAHILTTG